MINKLLFLTKTSLKRKIKTKWFLIANIILEEFRSGKLGKITLEAPSVEQGE